MKTESSHNNIVQRFTAKGVFPHQMAFTLLWPLRNVFLSPKKLLKRLALKGTETVMELGCGPGYFSPYIAKALPKGTLVLADIQPQMLTMAKTRLAKKECTNVTYYQCSGDAFHFPNAYFNCIYMVTVLGEIENLDTYLKELYRMLKPSGILSVTELAGDPDKIKSTELVGLLSEYGFTLDKQFGSPKNYTANFVK